MHVTGVYNWVQHKAVSWKTGGAQEVVHPVEDGARKDPEGRISQAVPTINLEGTTPKFSAASVSKLIQRVGAAQRISKGAGVREGDAQKSTKPPVERPSWLEGVRASLLSKLGAKRTVPQSEWSQSDARSASVWNVLQPLTQWLI